MGWTDERVATLRRLFSQGLSASQIAKQLGGVTRNAVIGKVHRLGLIGPTAGERQTPAAPRAVAPKASPAPRVIANAALKLEPASFAPTAQSMPTLRVVICNDHPVSLLELAPHGCRYPVNEVDKEHLFCGGRQKGDGPYCEAHAALCYAGKPQPKASLNPARYRWHGAAKPVDY